MRQLFIIYDERAMSGTEDAEVLCVARSLDAARRDVKSMFPRGVIYQYDMQPREGKNDELINETFVEGPGKL